MVVNVVMLFGMHSTSKTYPTFGNLGSTTFFISQTKTLPPSPLFVVVVISHLFVVVTPFIIHCLGVLRYIWIYFLIFIYFCIFCLYSVNVFVWFGWIHSICFLLFVNKRCFNCLIAWYVLHYMFDFVAMHVLICILGFNVLIAFLFYKNVGLMVLICKFLNQK